MQAPPVRENGGKTTPRTAIVVSPTHAEGRAITAAIRNKLKDKGIIIGLGGIYGNVLRLQPPLCITEDQANLVLEKIDEGLSVLEICRHLERIGDHATNIAEDVYFIVEAQLIKHRYEKFFNSEMADDDDEEK